MSRVEWSRREPGEVETALAIMLCRENPAAQRIRPSRGDRGVDVYVPDAGGWTVYQIKSFTRSLTGSQKNQIRDSWRSFCRFVKMHDLTISGYFLIRPEDPTWEDEKFLSDLTVEADFPCRWQGLDHCERLAADNASVLDYYLFDGKERLEETVRRLFSAIGGAAGSAPIDAGSTEKVLTDIHRLLNECDPHFKYDFEASSRGMPPSGAEIAIPNLVASLTRGNGDRAITFRIFARYREATTDRPVPGSLTPSPANGSKEAVAWRDFVEYGLPASGIPVKDMVLDLPGGLGSEGSAEGTITVGPTPAASSETRDFTLKLVDEQDEVVASADVLMPPPSRGLSGTGLGWTGSEVHGVFDFRLKIDFETPAKTFELDLASCDFTGAVPLDVIPALNFLSNFQPPYRLVLSVRGGKMLFKSGTIPQTLEDSEDFDLYIEICESLATIQQQTALHVRMPDLRQTPMGDAREWMRVAQLLRGDSLPFSWTQFSVTLHQDAAPPSIDDAVTTVLWLPLRVSVGGQLIEIGFEQYHVLAARMRREPDASRVVEFIPAGNDTGTITWVPQPG